MCVSAIVNLYGSGNIIEFHIIYSIEFAATIIVEINFYSAWTQNLCLYRGLRIRKEAFKPYIKHIIRLI